MSVGHTRGHLVIHGSGQLLPELCPTFSLLVAPLFKLTWSSNEWLGGELPPEVFKTFNNIHANLIGENGPKLIYLVRGVKFHLYVYTASSTFSSNRPKGELGTMLMQEDPDTHKKCIIGWAFRWLMKHSATTAPSYWSCRRPSTVLNTGPHISRETYLCSTWTTGQWRSWGQSTPRPSTDSRRR
jgi:hypothetical protein